MHVYIITTAANTIVLDKTYVELISVSSKNEKTVIRMLSCERYFQEEIALRFWVTTSWSTREKQRAPKKMFGNAGDYSGCRVAKALPNRVNQPLLSG